MKKNFIIVIIAVVLTAVCAVMSYAEIPDTYKSQYENDVKIVSLNLKVNASSDNAEYSIEGEILSKLEDNLTMKDSDGQVVRKMIDEYNLISQNNHSIVDSENNVTYTCNGRIKVFADSYDVYKDGQKVAYAEFNVFDTEGKLYNANGEKIAQYNSGYFRKDYTVTVFESCKMEDEDVLMIFASYVSDKRADAED